MLSPAILETIKTWVAYIGILTAAIVTAYAGIRKAIKDLKGEAAPGLINPGGSAVHSGVAGIVGGTIMETTTLLMWSESNRTVTEAVLAMREIIKANTDATLALPDELAEKLERVVNAINYNTEASREVCRDISELRHQVERLRDKMP